MPGTSSSTSTKTKKAPAIRTRKAVKAKEPATKPLAAKKQPSTEERRKRKMPAYKSFKMSRRLPHPAGPLPNSLVLIKKTNRLIRLNAKPLLGIAVIYALLYLVFVRGFTAPIDTSAIKDNLQTVFGKHVSATVTTGSVFAALLGSTNNVNSPVSGLYQVLLLVILSLAIIWTFRQQIAGYKPTMREAFYKGMYPLVPFLLVVSVMFLEALPLIIAFFLYGIIISGGIAVSGLEQALWMILFGALCLLSFYMLCSSLFSIYVVTLPDMTPIRALRSSRNLVFSRRLSITRKLLLVPFVIFAVIVVLVVPAIYFASMIAPWLYFALSVAALMWFHAYLFTLYRELL